MANVGLINAVENFDPTRGNKFSTYAVPTIKYAIMRELDKTQADTQHTSLNLLIGDNGSEELGDLIGVQPELGYDEVEDQIFAQQVQNAIELSNLTESEKDVVYARYSGTLLAHRKAGEKLNKTGEWVRTTEKRALKKLTHNPSIQELAKAAGVRNTAPQPYEEPKIRKEALRKELLAELLDVYANELTDDERNTAQVYVEEESTTVARDRLGISKSKFFRDIQTIREKLEAAARTVA